jgi:hypothetical protein
VNRLMIVARLRDGAHEEAERLLRNGPPFDPGELGMDMHGVYLTATDVIFVFDAPEVEWIVNDLVDDPVLADALDPWREIVEGPPRLAHERYLWSRADEKTGVGLGL